MQFFSQVGQDQYIYERFFKDKRGGVFLDIGAYDGVTFSNSLFFERYMGWTGLCIEPLPSAFAKLSAIRTARCERVCVSNFEGEADFVESDAGIDEKMLSGLVANFDPRHVQRVATVASAAQTIKVPVTHLSKLLDKYGLFDIDYCSIDTEGSELSILEGLDFDRYRIQLLTVENNYDDARLPELMDARGYDCIDKLEQDYVFKRRDDAARLAAREAARARLATPQVTVISAVWSQQRDRDKLIVGHAATLDRQTVPVNRVYVFDGGGAAPAGLDGVIVSVRESLTIYEAWNVALSLVRTPYVMNLNLDDRLAADAVERLVEAVEADPEIWLAGGDWQICETAETTDAIERAYPIDALPATMAWPPTPGIEARLGCADGLNPQSYGPACLWRMEAHRRFPRYPYRFADGAQIRIAGDALWWDMLTQWAGKRLARVPLIIGNYRTWPTEQAEFRGAPDGEFSRGDIALL